MTDHQRRLNAQADLIEQVLHAHGAPGQVTGGTLGPRLARFFVEPLWGVRFAQIRRLDEDLALGLRVPAVTVTRTRRGVAVQVPRTDPQPVELLPLLENARPLPRTAAALGLTADGVPLLARLASPDVAHILIAGSTGSGKSVLLRTIAASLALTHAADELRLVCIDVKARLFTVFEDLPHLLRPPLGQPAEISEVLRSLVRLMEIRDARREEGPCVIVCIDELADVIMTVDDATELLTRLAQRGREAGIHLVTATQRPSAAILSGLMRANFPLRLVGRVTSIDDARIAAGRGGTDAHTLQGQGDFLAVAGSELYRFQAAHISPDQLASVFSELGKRRGTDILPEASKPEAEPDWLAEGVELLLDNWSWWEDLEGQWGSKKRLHALLFPNKPYGGVFVDRAAQILEAARARATTTTRLSAQEMITSAE